MCDSQDVDLLKREIQTVFAQATMGLRVSHLFHVSVMPGV